jgi:hypothetical protein
MARKPKNPINDIVDTVGGWLGGRGPGTNPQVQAAMDATRAAGKVVDTATGGFGSALISDAQRMAQSGSSTPSALYKTAAVNLGAAAAGVGAAKVVGKALKQTGVAGRVANKIAGETVGLHGSPTQGLKSIDPRISISDVDVPTVSMMRTDVPTSLRAQSVNVTQQYAGREGSIYVVKAKKSATELPKFAKPAKTPKTTASGRPMISLPPSVATKSVQSAKVVAEIPLQQFPSDAALRKEIAKQTRLAGSSMRTKTVQDVVSDLAKKAKKKNINRGVS